MDNGYLPPTRMESHREKLQVEKQCEALRLMLRDLRQLNKKERRSKRIYILIACLLGLTSMLLLAYIIKNLGVPW